MTKHSHKYLVTARCFDVRSYQDLIPDYGGVLMCEDINAPHEYNIETLKFEFDNRRKKEIKEKARTLTDREYIEILEVNLM